MLLLLGPTAEITALRRGSEHASGDADRMDRRKFIILGAAAGLASPAAAESKKPKIGLLSWLTRTGTPALDQFRDGMQQFGYVEGKNYEIRVYSYEELLRAIAHMARLRPVLMRTPFAFWEAFAGLAEMLPIRPRYGGGWILTCFAL